MAPLPDPTKNLSDAERAVFDHMAAARAHSDGRVHLADIYVRMFNNPPVAEKVGALGELLRFGGRLPDDMRELLIMRYAMRSGVGYEWSHHYRPAMLAGISEATLEAIGRGDIPETLPESRKAALLAVDTVMSGKSIPAEVQQTIVAEVGNAGVVEIVALCGLYGIMQAMVIAFDIEVEPGLPAAPF